MSWAMTTVVTLNCLSLVGDGASRRPCTSGVSFRKSVIYSFCSPLYVFKPKAEIFKC